MGMNYYLKKNDGSKWIVPTSNFSNLINLLVVRMKNEGNASVELDIDKCVEELEELHIGKSSFGWHFNLCIYPCLDIYSLNDWKKLFNDTSSYTIYDEENEIVSADEMISKITERKSSNYDDTKTEEENCIEALKRINELEGKLFNRTYETYEEFLNENSGEKGYKGLIAHKSIVWDKRDEDIWKDFSPILHLHIRTDGTYDLTTQWDFS